MAKIQLIVNENPYEINADPQMPLLWVIEEKRCISSASGTYQSGHRE